MSASASVEAVSITPELDKYYQWVEPSSHITVYLALATAGRLQLEVLRGSGFRSQGGIEVGGILLGRRERKGDRTLVFIEDFELVPRDNQEHEAYVLAADEAVVFEAALAWARSGRKLYPVGYCRSHNRDGLFLAPADLSIIERFFREPDDLFLLIKKFASGACTAGFFFWKDGHIRADFTDSEAPLIPVALSAEDREFFSKEHVVATRVAPAPMPLRARRPDRPSLSRPLLRVTAIAGAAAALTFGVVRYTSGHLAGYNTAVSLRNPSQIATPAPGSTYRQTDSPTSDPTLTYLVHAGGELAAAVPDQPKLPGPAAAPQKLSERALEGAEPSARTRLSLPAVAFTRPIPVTTAPISENPIPAPPEIEAPRADAALRALTPVATLALSAPLASSAAAPASATPSPQALQAPVGPHLIHQVAPAVAPDVAHMILAQVEIGVEVAIDAEGKVTNARVLNKKGYPAALLIPETLKAAQACRFQPAQQNGRNIESNMVITFHFDAKGR